MNLRVKVFGWEAFTIELDAPQPTVKEAVEQQAETLLMKVMANPTVGKIIGRVSTAWVATGMKR